MHLVESTRYEHLKATGQLPTPKGVALAIVKRLQEDDYQVSELAQLVKSDPAITGRILKFVNAAAMGVGRPIVSLSNAVVLLGAYRIRSLVLGFSLLDRHQNGTCAGFDYERYWSQALATAIAAQTLAKYARIPADENFTAGLLCDVGELALASLFPERYGAVRGAAAAQCLLEAERLAFDVDHRQLGASMMVEWGLPQVLVAAAYYCEAPDACGHPDGSRVLVLSLALNFAKALAEICVAESDASRRTLPELYNKAARLGIGPDDLGGIVDAVVLRWREWGQLLNVWTRELPSFSDLLSAAALRGPTAVEAGHGDEHRRLLLISDPWRGSEDMSAQLQSLGYPVVLAPRGSDAVPLARREEIELVLIDTATPEIDGPVFCTAFNATVPDRDCYVILVGAPREESSLIRGVDAGADDYLLRPVSAQALRARLNTAEKMMQLKQEIRRERRSAINSADQWASTHRRLVDAAMNDPLTHLPNRRHGFDFLSSEWGFARANGRPLSCMMIDADHFKNINDGHGHDAGDAILVGLAEVACRQLRTHDLVFRFGGEEFYMVCPGANLANGLVVAERVRTSVAAATFRYRDIVIPVTVSIGVATLKNEHGVAEDLIRDADAALYRAKQNGRNRVEC